MTYQSIITPIGFGTLRRFTAGIRSLGGEALAVPADFIHEDAVTALFATVQKTYGRLDVLVNNTGIATHRDTEDITLEYWRTALDIKSLPGSSIRFHSMTFTCRS